MELSDSFEVPYGIDAVWGVLTDVERIAPCLPGAQLTGSDGDTHEGIVKVKVGPITSQYKGTATFTERDDDAHRLLMSAKGRDTRGAGNASAEITVALEALGETSTQVSVHTDLTITGKVAQFGRGVLADVSKKLMGQFAGNLAALVAADVDTDAGVDGATADGADADEGESPSSDRSAQQPAAAPPADVEAVDLLSVAGAPVIKRLVPVIVAAVIVVLVILVAVAF